jgi:hypothetical protein
LRVETFLALFNSCNGGIHQRPFCSRLQG